MKVLENNNIFRYAFLIIGVLSTITAFQLFGISLFFIATIITIMMQFVLNKGKLSYKYKIFMLVLWVAIIISTVGNLFLIDSAWQYANIKKCITFSIVFMGISLVFTDSQKEEYKPFFYKGLYISAIVQMVYGFVQFLAWSLWNVSINEIIMGNIPFLSQTNVPWKIVINGNLRLTGLGWEPAFFSFALVAGYLLSDKVYMKMLFIVCCLLSSSRTGMIAMFIAFVIDSGIIGIVYKKWEEKQKLKQSLIMVAIFVTLLGIAIVAIPQVRLSVMNSVNHLVGWKSTSSGGTHLNYYTTIPEIYSKGNLFHILFGYGLSSSGYPFSQYFAYLYGGLAQGAWAVESDFITMLLGVGIIGFVAYYGLLVSVFVHSKELVKKKMVVCLAVAGIMYIYIGTWTILFLALEYKDSKKLVHKEILDDAVSTNER